MKIKKGKDVIAFNIMAYILVGIFALACVIPFYLIIVGSITKENIIVTKGYQFFVTSKEFSLEAYQMALKSPESILNAYGVTIFVTVVGTALSIFLTTMTGYVLARPDFPWRNKISFFFFFTTLFNGGLVPWYLLCTKYFNFSNHMYSLIVPGLFSVWNMIIAKSFMKGIPFEMTEAAKIDGAGDFFIFYKVILPMAKPLIATLTLFIALAYWNDWYNCMLFMSTSDNWNLQYTLQNILNSTNALKRVAAQTGMQVGQLPSEGLKLAMTVIATGPIVLLYPFLQKYFVKGLTIGAVKG
ncbi:carbohydrate ABC transporter permease [Candidatus Galacturonibacter soehngenii]|uniref:Carbohydrate ABC transporter permease n=1 Tax=Candidatus Galacturonatibacter soehngenii TaxID=2307010 RepID=A0A7V7QJZ8_9FIRM|nr:carbohydrate ABC transporter permease [Candidatus Galacturonibacter soehngenii]KAB1438010.1 carbohydrate ABC transporter permease [Candidatus Galacturonibacter soehngenii]MBA4689008.1 carbohydrate ABC transporter permease [Candidatus Galacturonibacter soehngenii]